MTEIVTLKSREAKRCELQELLEYEGYERDVARRTSFDWLLREDEARVDGMMQASREHREWMRRKLS